ncbi:Uncharacterised protein [Mycobacterium tuberculosis]|nr:Uncharacterised protein [Mycobacterium tuberculosis]
MLAFTYVMNSLRSFGGKSLRARIRIGVPAIRPTASKSLEG